ncbi:MAG: hypothetical protein RR482_00635 [Clostridia bacterium]
MRSTLKVARIVAMQVSVWPRKPIFILGILLGMNFAFAPTLNLGRAALSIGASPQVFEPYILMASASYICLPLTLGLVLMLSDAPFTSEQIAYIGLRATRTQWVVAQCLYVFISCLVYQAVILVFSILLIVGNGYAGNVWSSTLLGMANNVSFGPTYSLSFSNVQFLMHYTPYQALAISFTLQTAYGFVLSMAMFSLNLLFHRGVGIATALALHELGYIFVRDGAMFSNQFLSLMAHALPAAHPYLPNALAPTLAQSGIVFATLSFLLVLSCLLRAKRVDYLIPGQRV